MEPKASQRPFLDNGYHSASDKPGEREKPLCPEIGTGSMHLETFTSPQPQRKLKRLKKMDLLANPGKPRKRHRVPAP